MNRSIVGIIGLRLTIVGLFLAAGILLFGFAPQVERSSDAVGDFAGGSTLRGEILLSTPAEDISHAPQPREIKFSDLRISDVALPANSSAEATLPPRITSLLGQIVRIEGHIIPSMDEFMMVCLICDQPPDWHYPPLGPSLVPQHHTILVRLDPDRPLRFTTRPIVVEGRFGIEEHEWPSGEKGRFYTIAAITAG